MINLNTLQKLNLKDSNKIYIKIIINPLKSLDKSKKQICLNGIKYFKQSSIIDSVYLSCNIFIILESGTNLEILYGKDNENKIIQHSSIIWTGKVNLKNYKTIILKVNLKKLILIEDYILNLKKYYKYFN